MCLNREEWRLFVQELVSGRYSDRPLMHVNDCIHLGYHSRPEDRLSADAVVTNVMKNPPNWT